MVPRIGKSTILSIAVVVTILEMLSASVSIVAADELVLQLGHAAPILAVAMSGDGRLGLTGSDDNTAIVWDLKSGRQLRTLRGHTEAVLCVALTMDGRRAATGSTDNTVIFWNVETGEQLRVSRGHSDRVRDVAFSPDDSHILSASRDKTAILWEVATGRVARIFRGHEKGVAGVAFRNDGKQIATASLDGTVVVWDIMSAKQVRTFHGHNHGAHSVSFSPDGRYLLAGGGYPVAVPEDEGVSQSILWDIKNGKVIQTNAVPGFNDVLDVAFTPDGRTALASPGPLLWDVKTGKKIHDLTGEHGKVLAASLSRDGRQLLSGSQDRNAILWKTTTREPIRHLRGRSDHCNSLLFSADGSRMLTAVHMQRWPGHDGASLWDLKTGKRIDSFSGKSDTRVQSNAISPDGRQVFIHVANGKGQIYNHTAKTTVPLKHEYQSGGFEGLPSTFSQDSQFLLTGSPFHHQRSLSGLPAMLWDLRAGRRLRTFEQERWTSTSAVAFSADGRWIATGLGYSRLILTTAVLWDSATGRELHRMQSYGGIQVEEVVVSNDGKYALVCYEEKHAELWDLNSGKKRGTFPDRGHATFSADGRQVGFFDLRRQATWWDIETGRKVHSFPLRLDGKFVHFSTDGRLMLYIRFNHATLIDTRTGKVHSKVRQEQRKSHDDWIGRAGLSPDSKSFVTVTNGGDRKLWDSNIGKLIRKLGRQDYFTMSKTPDGRYSITTKAFSGVYKLRAAATGKELHRLDQLGIDYVGKFDLSPTADRVLYCPWGKLRNARIVDTATGRVIHEMGDESLHITYAKFIGDGRFVLTCGKQDVSVNEELATGWDSAAIWNVADGQRLRTFQGHREPVTLVRFNPDGTRLLTVSQGVSNLWEIKSGKKLLSIRAGNPISGFEVNDELSRLARFSGRRVKIWNLVTMRQQVSVFHEAEEIRGIAFSDDAQRLLTHSTSGITIWDMLSGKRLREFRVHEGIRSAHFRPSHLQVASTHADGSIRLWDVSDGRELSRFYSLDNGTEWLTITTSGYYTGSPRGQKRVHWRKDGRVASFAELRDKFHRPDIVTKTLNDRKAVKH